MSPVKRRALAALAERRNISPSTAMDRLAAAVQQHGWHMEWSVNLERGTFEVKIRAHVQWALVEAALLPLQGATRFVLTRIEESWEVQRFQADPRVPPMNPQRRHLGFTYYLDAIFRIAAWCAGCGRGRRALRARCPVCGKVKFKILEPKAKHADKVDQPA